MPIKHIIKTDGTIVSAEAITAGTVSQANIVESGRDNQITSHGFTASGTLSGPWPIADKRVFKNDPLESDKFVPRYRLEGLIGSSSIYNREATTNLFFELFSILGKCAAYATSFGAIVQLATATSVLGGERNNNTGRQIGYKSHNRDKLGKYKNYLHGYPIRYLEKINFPIDIAQPFIKGEGILGFVKNAANELDYILLTNIYLLAGITEYFYKGNIVNDKIDNYIMNLVIEDSSNSLNPAKNTLEKAGILIIQLLNITIEAFLASEDAINTFKMLSNKIANRESFYNTINEEESPYLEKNGDPVIRFLHEQTQDYLFKFTIERINAGKELIKIAASKAKYDTSSGSLITSDERHYNTFGKLELHDTTVLKDKNRNSASIVALPQAFLLNNVAKTSSVLSLGVVENNFKDSGNKNRITAEQAKAVEDALNSEYMPFSIQDLRTREVIGLHAFIDSFSDSFSANYDESGGFGRVDKIQRWENTTRSISMSFYMISYNEDDHDLMWYQINKLVTMLYPQWSEPVGTFYYSEGSEYKGKEAFKFPFTKVPTATPLVRIRLGDVMTSNYSNISIRREHGYGTRAEDINLIGQAKLRQGTYIILDDEKVKASAAEIDKFIKQALPQNKISLLDKETQANITHIFDDKHIIANLGRLSILVKKDDFTTNIYENFAPLDTTGKIDGKLNNPITAGYETTMGEGLAGVIKSFNIEFSKELPWDIREGSRAPIYTKATLQFTPIHDIPPGLDHTGMMRAPVYKVGNIIRSMHYDIKKSQD
jgi:hypothetical protein